MRYFETICIRLLMNFQQLDLAFIDDFCLINYCYHGLQNGDFIASTVLIT